MINNPEDRRSPLTPQLALRVAIIGTFALAMFAVVFFRLWYLQVLSGHQYLAQASVNRVRTIDVPAPRGQIVDRSGTVLVDSIPQPAVLLSPPDLPAPLTGALLAHPPAKDRALFDRLSRVLGISTLPGPCPVAGHGVLRLGSVACQVAQRYALLPYANVTIKTGVNPDVQYYLQERPDEFPGVEVQEIWLRRYPLHDLASQLFGTIGPINAQQLHQAHFHGVNLNAVVGQSGLEYYYDHYLRGRDGAERVQVDANGNFRGNLAPTTPISGNTLKLSLDVPLQRVGESALQRSINSNYPSQAGAFVAMDPDNGEVYAMGSLPTFDPNIFTKPVSQSVYQQLNNPANNYPLINRAIQSAGPTGSTFKPLTATAALESGVWSVDEAFDDTGSFCEGGGLCRRNAGGAAYGVVDLQNAIRVSSDVFFYNLGALLNSNAPHGGGLQKWARLYGIGEKSGIDLGGEVGGTLPSPAWRTKANQEEVRCDHKHHVPLGSCGIADGRQWSQGDNVNLAVGQGDVQVTPLQLAVAYSAIANGGTLVKPHLGLETDAPGGRLVQKVSPPPVRRLHINPLYLDTIRAGLHAAAQSPGGTSYDVMGNFPQQVYGKTGTAQYTGQQDYAWYVCFVPDWATNRPILVAVHVEQGGFGAVAAAPVAREILSQWFTGNAGGFVAGASKTL